MKDTSLRVPSGMSGTVIDVQVFTREGITRDKRAQQIIDDELKRYRLDLNDQLRIVEGDAFSRLARMLNGKVANGGPKKLAKGTKIDLPYLEDLDHYHWFDIPVWPMKKLLRNWKPSRIPSSRSVTSSIWRSKKSARS